MRGKRVPNGLEQQIPSLCDPTPDNGEVKIANRRGSDDRQPNGPPTPPKSLGGGPVASPRIIGKRPSIIPNPAAAARPPHKIRPTGDGLHTATPTTGARVTVRLNDDVPNMPGVTGEPTKGPPVQHEPTPDTGGHNHPEHGVRPLPGPDPVLPEGDTHGIPGKHDGRPSQLPNLLNQRKLPPSRNVDRRHGAGNGVDRTRTADPNPVDGTDLKLGHHLKQRSKRIGAGRPRGLPQQPPTGVDKPTGNLGATNIQRQHGHPETVEHDRW